MQNFFFTAETAPAGIGFDLFSPLHLMWLAPLIVFAVFCGKIYKKAGEKKRKTLRLTFAALLLADEIFKHVMLIAADSWLPKYLSLHLCSINIFLIIYHAFRPNKTLGTFLYTVCIPAAVAAMLFPTWTCLPFLNFIHLHSFTVHILLAVYPMMLLSGGDIVRDIRKVPHCIGILLIMAAINFAVNLALDTNYMFLMRGDGTPYDILYNLVNGNRILYPLLVVALFLIYISLFYYVVYVIRRKARAKEVACTKAE